MLLQPLYIPSLSVTNQLAELCCSLEAGHSQESVLNRKDSNTSACGSNAGVSDRYWTSCTEASRDTYSLRTPGCIDHTSPFPAKGVSGFGIELPCQGRAISKQTFQIDYVILVFVPWPQVMTATPRAAAASLLTFSGTCVLC